MGQLKSDGKAIDVQAPGSTALTFGELYRIDTWTGIAMKTVGASDVDRNLSFEVSERIWYVVLPAAVTGARGDLIYWTAGAGFKRGTVDATGTATGTAIAKVEEAKDGNNVAGIRVLNIT